jgi:hypothetical protein
VERDGVPHPAAPKNQVSGRKALTSSAVAAPLGARVAAAEAGARATGLGSLTLSRPGRTRGQQTYAMQPLVGALSESPWAAAIRECWAGEFSDTPEGARAMELLTASRSANTNNNYSSKLRMYFEFCGARLPVLNPLLASQTHIIEYVAWQAERGRIHITHKNFQPYLSAINGFLSDVRRPRVAIGTAINDAVRACGRRQLRADGVELGRRLFLPAPAALAFVERAEDACESGWRGSAQLLAFVRPLLASAYGFQWFDRPHTSIGALWEDHTVDWGNAKALIFYERFVKTATGTTDRRSVTIPLGNADSLQRRLAILLDRFRLLKTEVCPSLARDGQPFWAIPADRNTNSWSSAVQGAWLAEALAAVRIEAPENFTYTAYSLRHGAASAAAAIGVPDPKLNYIGGWARGSNVPRTTYINPTCPATSAGREFFGFMTGERC